MRLLIVICILEVLLQVLANGPGTIFVNLVSYRNPSGKTDKGVECDSWLIGDKCDLVFSICLKNTDSRNTKFPCDIASINTLNHIFQDHSDVKFGKNIGFLPNPFNFTSNSMPESLIVEIRVTDDDISGQELISDLRYHVKELPIISADDDINQENTIVLSSRSSEMDIQVYGRCKKNYYGPGCRQFCQPSMSIKTGSYGCDRITGDKHCLIGWTGPSCQQRDLCLLENPCHGGSLCSMNGSMVNCVCPESLTGQFCQTPKRPCDTSPCLNGGLCVQSNDHSLKLNDQTICICPRNFTGKNCQNDVDECDKLPCKNDALCINTFGSYNCTCKHNHWGINCEKPPIYSIKSMDSAFIIETSTARFMQNMIIVLMITVFCLICIIGLLCFFYYKNQPHFERSQSIGSVYSECHFDEKPTHLTDDANEEIPYSNYYELENDNLGKNSKECFEKESVI